MAREGYLVRLVRQFVLNAVMRSGAILLGLIIEVCLVRFFLPEIYATWGVALSFSLIAIIFVQFGYQTSAIIIFSRTASGDSPGNLRRALVTAVAVWSLASIVTTVFLLASYRLFFPDISSLTTTLAIAAFVVARGFNTGLAEGLRGLGKVGLAAGMSGLGQHGGVARAILLAMMLVVLAVTGSLTLTSAIWASALASALVAMFLFAYLFRYADPSGSLTFADIWQDARNDFSLNARLCAAQLLQLGSSRFVANLIGGALAIGAALTPFLVAQQVAQLLMAPLTIINGAIPNLMIEAHRTDDRNSLEKIMRSASSLAFFISLAVAGVFVVMGRPLFGLIFGEGQENAYLFFLLLLPGLLFNSYTGSVARALALLGEERVYMLTGLATALCSLPLYWQAGSILGAEGLAVVTSLSLIGQNVAFLILVRKRFGVAGNAYLHPRLVLQHLRWIRSRKKGI